MHSDTQPPSRRRLDPPTRPRLKYGVAAVVICVLGALLTVVTPTTAGAGEPLCQFAVADNTVDKKAAVYSVDVCATPQKVAVSLVLNSTWQAQSCESARDRTDPNRPTFDGEFFGAPEVYQTGIEREGKGWRATFEGTSGGTIEIRRPTWSGITGAQDSQLDDYFNALNLHETRHAEHTMLAAETVVAENTDNGSVFFKGRGLKGADGKAKRLLAKLRADAKVLDDALATEYDNSTNHGQNEMTITGDPNVKIANFLTCGPPPSTTTTTEADGDGDGTADGSDTCPTVANPRQFDEDLDGLGNLCDEDIDGDGILNHDDDCMYQAGLHGETLYSCPVDYSSTGNYLILHPQSLITDQDVRNHICAGSITNHMCSLADEWLNSRIDSGAYGLGGGVIELPEL